MKIKEYLEQVAYKKPYKGKSGFPDSVQYFSKHDDSYITQEGQEGNVKQLADLEITQELSHGVGFSPKDGKWYGWSHRAIQGFSVGSLCEKGHVHYIGSTLEDQEASAISFWSDEHHSNVRCEGIITRGKDKFFDIRWDYPDTVKNESLHNTSGGSSHYIKPLGKGEWTAETLEDAKQMAVDFKEGVS